MSDTPEIGPIIQRYRKQRELTLGQLADISGVSKSMLSQIERGQANPTFAVLWSLTRALGIEFNDLIEGGLEPEDNEKITIVSDANTPEIKSADGDCTLRILSPPQMTGELEWYHLEIAPGGALTSGAHAPGTVEHVTVISGNFEITSDDANRTVKAGETARYAADVPHQIANTGKRAAKGLLVVV